VPVTSPIATSDRAQARWTGSTIWSGAGRPAGPIELAAL
jgi:hypothetical protein